MKFAANTNFVLVFFCELLMVTSPYIQIKPVTLLSNYQLSTDEGPCEIKNDNDREILIHSQEIIN